VAGSGENFGKSRMQDERVGWEGREKGKREAGDLPGASRDSVKN